MGLMPAPITVQRLDGVSWKWPLKAMWYQRLAVRCKGMTASRPCSGKTYRLVDFCWTSASKGRFAVAQPLVKIIQATGKRQKF